MDHEKLLAKYIRYIVEMEGTDYLGFDRVPTPFTEPEWDELRRLAVEDEVEETMIGIVLEINGCPFEDFMKLIIEADDD